MNRRRFLTFATSGLAALGLTGLAGAFAMTSGRNPYYTGPASGHFDGTRFFNPDGTAPKGFSDLMRWQFGGGRQSWPDAVAVTPARPAPKVDDLTVTMVGHATLLV